MCEKSAQRPAGRPRCAFRNTPGRFVIGEETESSTSAFSRCQSAALFANVNSFILCLLMQRVLTRVPTSREFLRKRTFHGTLVKSLMC
jgi:hypothetical protein